MAKATLKLSEAQIRTIHYCLDIAQLDLEQHTAEEKGEAEMQHFERSIEAMRSQLVAQGYAL